MSAKAEVVRNQRRVWAARDGSHDRLVHALKTLLPAAVGALSAVLLFSPFGGHSEIGFLLAKDRISVSPQRMRVVAARYSGTDSEGRAFSVTASNAIQRSIADPVVRLDQMSAMILLHEGPATLDADAGRYDPRDERINVDGPLHFVAADGYRIDTGNVGLDLNSQTLASSSPVSGTLPIGSFRADRMSADLQSRIVRLSGHARLRIDQGVIR